MSAVYASFPVRYEQCSAAQDVPVLTQCYESVRSDIVVAMPIRHDRHRGSLRSFEGRYEKVWIDPVCAIVNFLDIDYSSGKSSCLDQRYEVVQDFLGGSEIWHGSHHVDFALGQAVGLWQIFEVVQSYLGGSETWYGSHHVDFALGQAVGLWQTFEVIQDFLGGGETWYGTHDADFARGKAVCLCQGFEIIQTYLGGSEAWTSSSDVDFALGRALCLSQTFHIDQPYVGGLEAWPSHYESSFSSGRSNVLIQYLDVVQPYMGGSESWPFRLDIHTSSVTGQLFSVGMDETIPAGRYVTLTSDYDVIKNAATGAVFACDFVNTNGVFGVDFFWDHLRHYHFLAAAATTEVLIDAPGGGIRYVGILSTFDIPDNRSFQLSSCYDFTEAVTVCLPYSYAVGNAGLFLLQLQEEAYYEYSACLTNLHTGLVTTVTTTDLNESVKNLEEYCVGDASWEMKYETTVRFYRPDRPDQARDPVRWRFATRGGKHWKQGPVVSELRAVTLPSFLELHFTADWPYRSLELPIHTFQFHATEEGDFFDLGVWISDSLRFDTEQQPLLTIPYASGTTRYDVHVPRQENTRYVAVAPIRKFPYEEIGAFSVISVP